MCKERKFKIGDKVKCVAGKPNGRNGVVIAIEGDEFPYGVEFDKDYNGVSLCGELVAFNGAWCDESQLEYSILNFKIGDKVRGIGGIAPRDFIGTVTYIGEGNIAVAFEGFDGHMCSGHTPENNGWWCRAYNIEKVLEEPDPKEDVSLGTFREPENGALCECQVPEEFTSNEPIIPEPSVYYDEHYAGAIQPIELMQLIMTPEEFKGFLKGNIIKYTMRCGKKDDPEKEFVKIRRYKQWLDLAEQGITIDPRM